MATVLPPGPYRNIPLADGQSVPITLSRLEEGACVGPATRPLDRVGANGRFYRHRCFSHGWNNDWSVATGRYEHFLKGYDGHALGA